MGVAYYIALESKIEGLDTFMNGKALVHADFEEEADPTITKIANDLGVKNLADFMSESPESLLADLDPDGPRPIWADDLPPEEWFEPQLGLTTVNALLAHLRVNPNLVPNQDAVINDLHEMVRILSAADKNGVRWHLAVDV